MATARTSDDVHTLGRGWHPAPGIEGVFFDGDQTLWDFELLMRRALASTLAYLRELRPGPDTAGLDVESMAADRAAVAADPRSGGLRLEQLRLAAFNRTLERVGLPDRDLANALNDHYLQNRFTDVPLFDDVLPALSELSATMPLGLLSNGNGYPDRSGLTGVFTVVVFSDEHGISKPDRRLFDIAAEHIAISPARLAMVGDSPAHDVAGAQNAGWRGIWLNRDRRPRPPGVLPDAELHTLRDLSAALATMP